MANELPHSHQGFFLQVEHFIVYKDVRVLVQIEGVLYFVQFIFEDLVLIILYFLEVELADHRAFIVHRAQQSLEHLSVI